MTLISPRTIDKHVIKLLNRMGAEFEPEQVPVVLEPYSKFVNCFNDVAIKVKKDGGSIHYGWAIFKSDILCEAERHAVWESPEGNLIDITPREIPFTQIMFVSDNDFVYNGQLVDNVRVNITSNSVVDDFIMLCENLESLYTYGKRIDDQQMIVPEPARTLLIQYENLKREFLSYIRSGGKPYSLCICKGELSYRECHGKTIKGLIIKDMSKVESVLGKIKN